MLSLICTEKVVQSQSYTRNFVYKKTKLDLSQLISLIFNHVCREHKEVGIGYASKSFEPKFLL